MNNLPITNIEKWEHKRDAISEYYLYKRNNISEEFYIFNGQTRHATAKGPTMIEGILILWKGNTFNLDRTI